MAITAASLADGQLAGSIDVLYGPVGASTAAHVHIHLANTSDANSYKVNIYITRSGSDPRSVSGFNHVMPPSSSANLPDGPLSFKLSTGDQIEGYAEAADVIDYTITGGTEPV